MTEAAARADAAPSPSSLPAGRSAANANSADARPRASHQHGILARVLDDGFLVRWAFRLILVGALAVLALDFQQSRALPEPAPSPGWEQPVLPPMLTDGVPEAPPHEIETPAEALREPATIELRSAGVLSVEGAFDPGVAERFAQELEARGEYVKTVALNSPGGSVEDAVAMSGLIRERGLSTEVGDGHLCASSCPIVMAGGVERRAGARAVVGVHQIYGLPEATTSAGVAMSRAQSVTASVSRHLSEMGIEPGLWLHALETPPDRLYYLDAEAMRELALTTD